VSVALAAAGVTWYRVCREESRTDACHACRAASGAAERDTAAVQSVGLHVSDAFLGLAWCGSHMLESSFIDAVEAVQQRLKARGVGNGVLEMMCHPGSLPECDEEEAEADSFSKDPERHCECRVLCADSVKTRLSRLHGVQLSTFASLRVSERLESPHHLCAEAEVAGYIDPSESECESDETALTADLEATWTGGES
jgi:hypothetical protein